MSTTGPWPASPALTPGALVGLGIDLVDIPRFEAVLERRPTLAGRLFSDEELRHASTLSRPVPTLAGRFAAKEAVMKVLGVGLGAVDWADISVARRPGGAPALTVRGRAGRLASERGIQRWEITISHTATVAAATVVGLA